MAWAESTFSVAIKRCRKGSRRICLSRGWRKRENWCDNASSEKKKKKSVVAVCGVFTDIVHRVQLYSNATSNFVFNNSYRNHAASTRFPRKDQRGFIWICTSSLYFNKVLQDLNTQTFVPVREIEKDTRDCTIYSQVQILAPLKCCGWTWNWWYVQENPQGFANNGTLHGKNS